MKLAHAALAALLLAATLAFPLRAQDTAALLADPTGFWLVAERGPPVNAGIAALPIFGAATRAQIGNPRAVWDIRREGDALVVEIRPRGIVFRNVALDGDRLTGDTPDPDNPNARVRLDARIADGKLAGTLAFAAFALELDGRPPESVAALRAAFAEARARLDEIDGPYIIPEIEKLRLENIVLIERIRRVEGELAARGAARPAPAPAPAAPAIGGQIAMRGLAPDLQTRGTARLRAAPDASAAPLAQLPAGQALVKLADAARPGWSLVATPQGTLGYVAAADIGPLQSAAAAPRAAREVVVSFPAWDAGRAGRRMTVPDAGFVSLVGRVRGEGAFREVRIADAQIVSNRDGSFTAVVPVEREGRRVRIEALFANGPPAVLEFDIAVGR